MHRRFGCAPSPGEGAAPGTAANTWRCPYDSDIEDGRAGIRDPRTARRALAGTVAVLAAGLLLGAAGAQERKPIAEFSGSGDQVTESFTVDTAWSAEWSSEDERIEILLRGTDSGITSLLANPVDPGQGRAVYAQDGKFHFEIRAEGPWRIAVFEE